MLKIICVIPVRYDATRFPGKPLAMLRGKPMVRRVWEIAKKVEGVDRVLIATDDKRIFDTAKGFGAEAVMTSPRCPSGTDRVAEAVSDVHCSFVVNLQGDEPLMPPSVIKRTIAGLVQDNSAVVSTPVVAIPSGGRTVGTAARKRAMQNPNFVKVVFDRNGHALYFSRSVIPDTSRVGVLPTGTVYMYKHIGLYVYRKKFLERFVRMPQSRLEKAEKLEQLRILENGFKIKVVVVDKDTVPVDTPRDLKKAENYLKRKIQ